MEFSRIDEADATALRHILGGIDRAEHVDVQYVVIDGRLTTAPVKMVDVPAWRDDDGPHSVGRLTRFSVGMVERGGITLVAHDGPSVAGIVIVVPEFEPPLAWLGLLHVSRPHRRQGVASALHGTAESISIAAGATSMYVSASPTGSAVGFYLSRGYELATPPHPALFELEPDDVHLVLDLSRSPEGASS
ncbi:MAG TPA: GNAT family N-acetyltransferase [Ilumatobacteraceae bacterium]|nr:GNAT family N-acetyltransferase [Ilumatobacteraceae bacterium]